METVNRYSKIQLIGLFLGAIVFFLLIIFPLAPTNIKASMMAAVAILMAIWWITEAIPLGATALLPMIFFPLLGIMSGKQAAPEYFNSIIFLFIGGFLIAIAMEKWNLHKRISLIIIKLIGSNPSKLVLGFMLASALLSMFISNTATAIMMLPIGLAIILKIEEKYSPDKSKLLSVPLMLGIAYGASIGGIATLVGTPPNLVFIRIYQMSFPKAPEISFGNWMILAVPISIIMLFITWFLITKIIYKIPKDMEIDRSVINQEYKDLGKMHFEEKVVLIVFISTAILWIFRTDLHFGALIIPGWSKLFGFGKMIDDSTIAIFMAFIFFVVPAKSVNSKTILTASSFKKIPWEIIVLFGGGFALAKGFETSGLSTLLGQEAGSISNIHPILVIFVVSLGIKMLTELTSNTATTQTILPILASISVAMHINPLFLMIPATLSASMAFMLPVATPPNAIVFGSGRIKILEMARTGIIIDLTSVIVVTLLFYFLGDMVFNINPFEFPVWAG